MLADLPDYVGNYAKTGSNLGINYSLQKFKEE